VGLVGVEAVLPINHKLLGQAVGLQLTLVQMDPVVTFTLVVRGELILAEEQGAVLIHPRQERRVVLVVLF
jgi:hypothetical protein